MRSGFNVLVLPVHSFLTVFAFSSVIPLAVTTSFPFLPSPVVSAFSNLQPCTFFHRTLPLEWGFSAFASSFYIPVFLASSSPSLWSSQWGHGWECSDWMATPAFPTAQVAALCWLHHCSVCSSASWLSARAPSPAITKLLEMLKRVLSARLFCPASGIVSQPLWWSFCWWCDTIFFKLFLLLNALVVVTKEWASAPHV